MKKKLEKFKTKTTQFIGNHKEEILLCTGYVVGVAVAFAAISDRDNRAWNKADLYLADCPDDHKSVKDRNGKFYCISPKAHKDN